MASVSVRLAGFAPGEAVELANRLGLPLRQNGPNSGDPPDDGWLERDPSGRLVLALADGGAPIRVDAPRAAARDEALLRALGIGRGVRSLVDATAGLGRDGLRAAMAGGRDCRVVLVEREPWLVALLEDGVRSISLDEERLRVVHADAASWLEATARQPESERPDAVLLDPMFEPLGRGKSSLPKRELQVLRRLCAQPADGEVDRLVALARRVATRRVVLKRRSNAPRIDPGGDKPLAQIRGRLARYDVYGPKVDATKPDRS